MILGRFCQGRGAPEEAAEAARVLVRVPEIADAQPSRDAHAAPGAGLDCASADQGGYRRVRAFGPSGVLVFEKCTASDG